MDQRYTLDPAVNIPRFLIGQTIFDPFLGSGTTGVAALSLGRLFIGCDISRKEVNTSLVRISQLEPRMNERGEIRRSANR